MRKILITSGVGFIGYDFIKFILKKNDEQIFCLDLLIYDNFENFKNF